MVKKFTSRIKTPNLAEMFALTYSLIRNIVPIGKRPLICVDAMKMGRNIPYIFNFSPSEWILTKFGIRTKSLKMKLFC